VVVDFARDVQCSSADAELEIYHQVIYIYGDQRVRVFKTRDFARFARKEHVDDEALCDAIARAERGLVDAALGGGLIKQRVPRKGEGRSGGFRTIVAYRQGNRSFFMYGFAKNVLDNIPTDDLKIMKETAKALMLLPDPKINDALRSKSLQEIHCDG
jgi:hypothetical protein